MYSMSTVIILTNCSGVYGPATWRLKITLTNNSSGVYGPATWWLKITLTNSSGVYGPVTWWLKITLTNSSGVYGPAACGSCYSDITLVVHSLGRNCAILNLDILSLLQLQGTVLHTHLFTRSKKCRDIPPTNQLAQQWSKSSPINP